MGFREWGIGMVCKIAIELMFIPSKGLGVYAYSISIVVGVVVSGILNLYAVERYSNNIIDIKYLIKQFAISVLVFGLFVVFKIFDSTWVFILGSMFTAIVYLVSVYLFKLFSKEDIKLLINSE